MVPDPAGLAPWPRPAFRQIDEELVHQAWFVRMVRANFEGPDGQVFDRTIVRHPGAVAIVAVNDAHEVLLVHQYRPAVDRWVLELPAGTCDVHGEPAEESARRELAEEVGVTASRFELLTRCLITPGFCDEYSSIFLARDLQPVPTSRHGAEEESLAVVPVPLETFDEWVDNGIIIDACAILGVSLARRRLLTTS